MSENNQPSRKRSARLTVRMTEEEKVIIEERAHERRMGPADYLIRTGLGRATRQRADVDIINRLRECREQLKLIYHSMNNAPEHEKLSVEKMETIMDGISGSILGVWKGVKEE